MRSSSRGPGYCWGRRRRGNISRPTTPWVGRLPPEKPNRDPSPGAPVRHLSRARRSGRSRGENSIGTCSATKFGSRGVQTNSRVSAQKGRISLHFDGRPGVLELLLHRSGLVLTDVLFHCLGCSVHEVLGLLEPETRELADRLDHVDLRRARFLKDHTELGLLLGLGGCGRPAGATTSRRDRDRRGGHAPAVLQVLAELRDLEDRPGLQLSRDLLELGIL